MTENKYHLSTIYRIVSLNDDTEFYIGSTYDTLCSRLSKHKYKAKEYPERALYIYCSRVGWDSIRIFLVENFKCESKIELLQRERYWIDELKPTLNTYRAMVTQVEAQKDLTAKKRRYRQKYKEEISVKAKQRYEENVEAYALKAKEYYEKNKAIILEQRKERIKCVCGVEASRGDMLRHTRTTKHITRIQREG